MNKARRDELRERIRGVGLRATQARVCVLDRVDAASSPMSHGQVADALDPDGYDRATVFRNLNDLAEAGLVRRADFGDHVWRYELAKEAHVHFVCTDCGDVQCLPKETVTVKTPKGSPRALGLAAGAGRDVEINISGSCDSCL